MPSGTINIQMRGMHGRGDHHPIEVQEALNQFAGLKTLEFFKLGTMSQQQNTFYDQSVQVTVPARPAVVIATMPASPFSDVYSVALTLTIPAESRGGRSMVETQLVVPDQGQTRVVSAGGSYHNFKAIFREGHSLWNDWKFLFLSRQPMQIYLSGYEDFGTWSEGRGFINPVTVRLEAWGES